MRVYSEHLNMQDLKNHLLLSANSAIQSTYLSESNLLHDISYMENHTLNASPSLSCNAKRFDIL